MRVRLAATLRGPSRGLAALLAVVALGGAASSAQPSRAEAWPFTGSNLRNTRHATEERRLGARNVAALRPLWTVRLRGATQATPVSDGGALFVPTALGYLYRIERDSGRVTLELDLASVLGIAGAAAKDLAVTKRAVYFGTQNTAVVAAIDKRSGALLWKTVVDDHPMARITQPPIVVDERVLIGVSGVGEEIAATKPPYKCCSFRGSVLALDARSGKVLWKTYTLPEGFAGASVWSRTPAFDRERRSLYITTGNMYWAPAAVRQCVTRNRGDEAALAACYPSGVWYDSIIALDPRTGAIKWGHRTHQDDIFTGSCLLPELGADNCGGGPDFDFGNGAMLWRTAGRSRERELVGAGQKSGVFWALNPDDGRVVWRREVGPGGPNGGIQQASATDGRRVYVALANAKQVRHRPAAYTLPSGETIRYGSFAALDAASGAILWQVPDPAGVRFPGNDTPCEVGSPPADCQGAFPKGPVSVANGVMYACSTAPTGPMYAFDAATGALLWTFESGSSCSSGAAVVDGTLYWVGGHTLYAFSTVTLGVRAAGAGARRAVRTVSDGVYAAEQARHGKDLYLAHCSAGCHLPNLVGNGPSPGLIGGAFLERWAELSLADLYRKIATTMPVGQPGALSDADYIDVVAYLMAANGFPPGSARLANDAEVLRTIDIPGAPSSAPGEASR